MVGAVIVTANEVLHAVSGGKGGVSQVVGEISSPGERYQAASDACGARTSSMAHESSFLECLCVERQKV